MQVFNSFQEMQANQAGGACGSMSVFNARMPDDMRRRMDEAMNAIHGGIQAAMSIVGGYRKDNPDLTEVYQSLGQMRDLQQSAAKRFMGERGSIEDMSEGTQWGGFGEGMQDKAGMRAAWSG